MKISLQYAGMIRTLKIHYIDILEILKPHDVDVFISIWDIPGTSFKHSNNKNKFPELNYKNINQEFIKKEFPEFNFKIIDIEKYQKSIEVMNNSVERLKIRSNKFKDISKICMSEAYKINRCNEFRKKYQKNKNIKYDWFIKLRCDGSFDKIFELEKIKKPTFFLNKYIYETNTTVGLDNFIFEGFIKNTNFEDLSPIEKCKYIKDNSNGAWSQNTGLWVSNDENLFNKMCNMFNNNNFIQDMSNIHNNQDIFGERLIGKYLIYTNVVKFTKTFDFNLKVLRSSGYYQIYNKTANKKKK